MRFRNSILPLLQALLSIPGFLSAVRFKSAKLLVAGILVFGPGVLGLNSPAQERPGSTVAFVTPIQWNRQPGVSRYRLQIAGDEVFKNVFYDGVVTGERYAIRNLSPGYYYWRVAPLSFQTREFSRPVRLFISGGVITSTTYARSYENR